MTKFVRTKHIFWRYRGVSTPKIGRFAEPPNRVGPDGSFDCDLFAKQIESTNSFYKLQANKMKKFLFVIAFLVVLVAGTSAYNEERFDTVRGDDAPLFEVSDNGRNIALGDLRGRYALITFWESSDAASRSACSTYSAVIANTPGLSDQVTFIGINFDNSRALFEEIVSIDGLDQSMQYRVDGDAADQIVYQYGLTNGMGSILIDPKGRVVTYNPDPEMLKELEC